MTIKEFAYQDVFIKTFGSKRRIEASLTEFRRLWPSGYPDARKNITIAQAATLIWILGASQGTKDVKKSLIAISNVRSYNSVAQADIIVFLSQLLTGKKPMINRVKLSQVNFNMIAYLNDGRYIAFPEYDFNAKGEHVKVNDTPIDAATIIEAQYLKELGDKIKK